MIKNKSQKGTYGIRGLLYSSIILTIIFFLVTVALTAILYRSEDPTAKAPVYSFVSLLTSGVVGGFVSSRIYGFKTALLGAVLVALLMLLLGIIISSGGIGIGAFMNYFCYIATSLVGAYLGRPREKKRKRHR